MMASHLLRNSKSLWSYNPLPNNCILFLPGWSPDLRGSVFKSIDPFGHAITRTGVTKTNDSFSFDGNDYLALPSGAGLTPATGTIIIWVKFSRGDTSEYLYSSTVDELSVLHNAANEIRLFYDSIQEVNWTVVKTIGEWVHLAFAFTQGGAVNGYEDGTLKASTTASVTAPTEGTPKIATIHNATGTFFVGDIGEFYMYDDHKTIGQIQYHRERTRGRYKV